MDVIEKGTLNYTDTTVDVYSILRFTGNLDKYSQAQLNILVTKVKDVSLDITANKVTSGATPGTYVTISTTLTFQSKDGLNIPNNWLTLHTAWENPKVQKVLDNY